MNITNLSILNLTNITDFLYTQRLCGSYTVDFNVNYGNYIIGNFLIVAAILIYFIYVCKNKKWEISDHRRAMFMLLYSLLVVQIMMMFVQFSSSHGVIAVIG